MELEHIAIITTSIVIAIGIIILIPSFQPAASIQHKPPRVILAFEKSDVSTEQWCNDIVGVLEENNLPGIMFITGRTAEQQPACITSFVSQEDGRDIGTYGYTKVNLLEGSYVDILNDINDGKSAIERIGAENEQPLTIKAFKGAKGVADDNVYSFLSRNNFTADFTYADHYNKYENSSAYWLYVPIHTYEAKSITNDDFKTISTTLDHVSIIYFSDESGTSGVNELLKMLRQANPDLEILSASKLVGHPLTVEVQ